MNTFSLNQYTKNKPYQCNVLEYLPNVTEKQHPLQKKNLLNKTLY